MARAEIISLLALLVAATSLFFSVYFNLRDRARLIAKSQFILAHPDYGPARILVTVVNAGRRPVILRMWGGSDEKGEWVGESLGKDHAGLRLSEHEQHELSLEKNDLYAQLPDGEVLYRELWVEDSLGQRHSVRDSKRNVELLWKT